MVSSVLYKRISLLFWIYFVFGVSENTTKYVDIVRMISSIPSLTSYLFTLVGMLEQEPAESRAFPYLFASIIDETTVRDLRVHMLLRLGKSAVRIETWQYPKRFSI
jgi:hypothetical protein